MPKAEKFWGVIYGVIWWHTIFRDWLLKWRSLYKFHWSLESCLSVQLFLHEFKFFVLNSLFASISPLQIQKVILSLGDYMQATCHACIGGTNVRSEINKLSAGAPHIVVGTPGRVFDMLSRGHLCEYSNWWPPVLLHQFSNLKLTDSDLQVQNSSRCLFWMRLMRCWVGASKIRFTRSSRNWVQTFK